MRILLSHMYCWPEVRRGGERYVHEFGAALSDAGHDVRIVSSSPLPGRDHVLGVDVWRLPRRSMLHRHRGEFGDEFLFGLEVFARLGGARRFDVWHAFSTADGAAAAFASTLRPGLVSAFTALGFPSRRSRDRRPDRRLHEFIVRRADHYLCLSECTGSYLSTDYGRSPEILGGGVDTRRFCPADRRSAVPAVLFAGALDESRKNLPLLLEAVARLRWDWPDLELWLSGSGDPSAAIDSVPGAADAVVKYGLGTRDELVALYGRAWVTVLPAHFEAFGLVLVESLACGTPIVALRGTGSSEIVEDGIGFMCDENASSIASAVHQALELSTQADTTDRCRAVAERFDWRQSVVPRAVSIYRGEAAVIAT